MNISNLKNLDSRKHYQFKSELIDWIVGQGFTHGLSLSHHRAISLERATTDLRKLHRDIDRKLLGCRYNTSPERAYGLYFFEGQADIETLHVHALLKIAPRNHARFEHLFADDIAPEQNLWKRIAPAGTHKHAAYSMIGLNWTSFKKFCSKNDIEPYLSAGSKSVSYFRKSEILRAAS